MRNYKEVLKTVKEEVKKRLKSESAHDYWHCYRVVQMAGFIGEKEKADLTVLELAGWLHDIAHPVNKKDHDIEGAKFVQKYLPTLKFDSETVNKVINCVKNTDLLRARKRIL